MIKPKKPKKVAPFPLQTGGAFKIFEPKASVPPTSPTAPPVKKSPILKKKPVEVPPQVAKALKLVDEEEVLEVEQPVEVAPRPTLQVPASVEESEVGVMEAPLVKKRKLKKVVEPIAPVIEPTTPMIKHVAPVIKPAALVVETVNVADFLAIQRK
jgi:hypothetical protein